MAIDTSKFITYKDEDTSLSKIGITKNKIVEIVDFIDSNTSKNIIDYFEANDEYWGDIAFYGSRGMGIEEEDKMVADYGLPIGFFSSLKTKFQEAVSTVFGREVTPNTSHAQKWEVGGFATPHSDNSDFDGNPTSFEINKYVGILYLNDDYEGGELYFVDNSDVTKVTLTIKPKAGSFVVFPGGIENIHGVREIKEGERYTMVSFWDFAEAEYSEERRNEWQEEFAIVREQQKNQREEWESGNKDA
jgi:hypothetical protein